MKRLSGTRTIPAFAVPLVLHPEEMTLVKRQAEEIKTKKVYQAGDPRLKVARLGRSDRGFVGSARGIASGGSVRVDRTGR